MNYQMISEFTSQNYVPSGMKSLLGQSQSFFSKMTFAELSQATAATQRFYHRTQNTFNRIQNTYMTIEIHDQGMSNKSRYEP